MVVYLIAYEREQIDNALVLLLIHNVIRRDDCHIDTVGIGGKAVELARLICGGEPGLEVGVCG